MYNKSLSECSLNLPFSTTEPDAVLPLTHTHNDSHATVEWSGSSDYLVARYIVDVRQYVASGPGKAEPHSIIGYPQQLSATQLNHTVQVLSELNFSVQLYHTVSVCMLCVWFRT